MISFSGALRVWGWIPVDLMGSIAAKPSPELVAHVLGVCALLAFLVVSQTAAQAQADLLPSWNEGENKQNIIRFVQTVTDQSNKQLYVRPEDRIATFDLDGTLWTEQPEYAEVSFVKYLAHDKSELLTASSSEGLFEKIKGLFGYLKKGIPIEDYAEWSDKWLKQTKHPCFDQNLHTELVYQPMIELLKYLRANGFKTYIVSGSGTVFLRTFSESAFGIPPEQVVGSTFQTEFKPDSNGTAELRLFPVPEFIDDKSRKVVSINEFIGRRPVAAFGNSDGDQQMLEFTGEAKGPRLMGLVHHTDAEREYAYDENVRYGRLSKAVRDEVTERKSEMPEHHWWLVVDMKNDWKTIYGFDAKKNGSPKCQPR